MAEFVEWYVFLNLHDRMWTSSQYIDINKRDCLFVCHDRLTKKGVPLNVYSYDIDKWNEQVFLWSQTVTGINVFATCCAILLFEHTKENTNAGIDESCTC